MPTLYLSEQNAWIKKTGDRLVVEKDDQVLADIPCLHLDTVLLYGNVQFTTQALVEMLDHGIELALLTRGGRLRGQLTPPKAKNIVLRMGQYERSRNPEFCLAFAQAVVEAKIDNGLSLVREFRTNHPERLAPEAIVGLENARSQTQQVSSLQQLLGVEGHAAALYFELLRQMIPEALRPPRRARRPPPDPFNALLSFGYVLVGNELQALLDAMGFDPYLGFYHQIDYGRPSLALDLLEEFRPAVVDRLVVALLNLRQLGEEDFQHHPRDGVRLSREGLKAWFGAYEQALNKPRSFGGKSLSFRQAFRRQAERLARVVQGQEGYEGFRL